MCSERLAKIDMDSILESGYVEELISDHPYSPFLVMQTTQRPDLVAASLIEGKVALLIDGSPIALVMPVTFWYAFQTVEDYYMNFIFATILRWLRFLFGLEVSVAGIRGQRDDGNRQWRAPPASYLGHSVEYTMLASFLYQPRKGARYAYWGVIAATFFVLIAMLMATVTMGTNLAQDYDLFYRSGCDGFCVFSAKRIGSNGQLFA